MKKNIRKEFEKIFKEVREKQYETYLYLKNKKDLTEKEDYSLYKLEKIFKNYKPAL